MPLLQTDPQPGSFLTTEAGQIIVTDVATTNFDIQQFDFYVDLLRAMLWEYNDAANLQSILQQKQDWYTTNQTEFWQDFVTNIFDLRTANEFGLAVWSIILELPLFVNYQPSDLSQPIFGFDVAFFKNFNRGGFGTSTGGTNRLSMASQRLALQLRYFQLCSSGTVPEINRFMNFLFGSGAVFLLDNLNMTQQYIFTIPITADMQYIFENFDLLPRPAGVGVTYHSTQGAFWGFGPYRKNFNRGNFQT